MEFGDYMRGAAEALRVVVWLTGSGFGNGQGGWEGVRGHGRGSRSNAGVTHTAQRLGGGGPVGRSGAPRWGHVVGVVVVWSLSHFQLFAASWAAARQASLSFTISWSLLRSWATHIRGLEVTILRGQHLWVGEGVTL